MGIFGIKDILLVGGLVGLALIIRQSGKDLFNAFSDVQLPSIGDISLPSISIPNPFEGSSQTVDNATQAANETVRNVVDQSFTQVPEEQRTPFDSIGAGLGASFAGIGSFFESLFNPSQPEVQGVVSPIPVERPLDLTQLASQNESPVPTTEVVQSQIEGQQFQGGGEGFIGGVVRETPLSTLSQIIDRFGVGATEASDILARIRNDFGEFDFGTNTGSGVGSVIQTPEINTEISNLGTVSDPIFEGLTAEEIASRLTGGNISNF